LAVNEFSHVHLHFARNLKYQAFSRYGFLRDFNYDDHENSRVCDIKQYNENEILRKIYNLR